MLKIGVAAVPITGSTSASPVCAPIVAAIGQAMKKKQTANPTIPPKTTIPVSLALKSNRRYSP
jgi:hypothetical protein